MTRELLYFYAVVFLLLEAVVLANLHAGSSSDFGSRSMIREKSGAQLSAKPPSIREGFVEGKPRLGSIPPNCRNKCNACSPCRVIQVPTSPTHAGATLKISEDPRASAVLTPEAVSIKYSNYKPIWWKCKCGHRLFNP